MTNRSLASNFYMFTGRDTQINIRLHSTKQAPKDKLKLYNGKISKQTKS